RSLVGWAFWRGSASHLNEPPPAGDAPGRLFGRPLSSICVDGALPKPIMDFLRRIPGSLLGCEVYEEWMDVLEEEDDEEEQVLDIKLAKENALLLRHLLAVLHAVQVKAQENQMTSFNLSVCIAPSLLWPPGAPCSPEVEGRGAKK
uniref:Rho-GAP domain-containing protein n=1 Tax=Xiphophorus maculatus TaxID=8083 RepID=A0A3B5QIB8_XIPMA